MASFRNSDGELVELTEAEKLMLGRRRQGLTQGQMAELHGVPRNTWCEWESGRETVPANVRVASLGKITAAERCLIMRLRSGERQVDIAQALRVCAYTIRKMEQGKVNCQMLLDYWET